MEKTSEVIIQPFPKCHIHTSRDGDTFPTFEQCFSSEILPDIQPEPPPAQLEAVFPRHHSRRDFPASGRMEEWE